MSQLHAVHPCIALLLGTWKVRAGVHVLRVCEERLGGPGNHRPSMDIGIITLLTMLEHSRLSVGWHAAALPAYGHRNLKSRTSAASAWTAMVHAPGTNWQYKSMVTHTLNTLKFARSMHHEIHGLCGSRGPQSATAGPAVSLEMHLAARSHLAR